MNKRKSKKGYTLVELVLTIAILAITASMGVGILVSVMNNYGQAAKVSHSQQQVVQLENLIREYFKVGGDVQTIPGPSVDPLAEYGTHFYTKGDGVIYIDNHYKATSTEPAGHTSFNVTGIKKLEMVYNIVENPTVPNSGYVALNYKIIANDDFELSGSMVLNNSKIDSFTLADGEYIELRTEDTGAIVVKS